MRRLHAIALACAAGLAAGCGADFEDPSIVIDLRMLGATVDPPEVLVPIDADPDTFPVPDFEICALVADPAASRGLAFEMAACAPTGSLRCDNFGEPVLQFSSGAVEDPEEAEAPVQMCGTLRGSPVLVEILQLSIEEDPLQGFSRVAVQIEMFVKPSGGSDDDGIFGAKAVLFGAQLPAERTANTNPSVDGVLLGTDPDADPDVPVTLRKCAATDAVPIVVAPGDEIALLPVETDGTREDYVLPTFDGGSREFTENMTYAWFATDGEWSSENTGGPKDAFGNVPQLDSSWTAPDDIDTPTNIDMWLVQRDERGGLAWYEMCVRVEP
jgi:hypothetical protein